MKKLASSLTNMLLVLTLVSVVAAFLLAYVNNVTSKTIKSEEVKKEAEATKKVLSIENQEIYAKSDTIKDDKQDFILSFIHNMDSCFIGATVKTTNKQGFGGDIEVLVGFDAEGKILGYEVLKHSETPGLGARMNEWFRAVTSDEPVKVSTISKIFFGNPAPAGNHNIIGRDIAQGTLKVTKDGGDIDAITASTITSRAFLNAVNQAYEVYMKGEVTDANSGATAQN